MIKVKHTEQYESGYEDGKPVNVIVCKGKLVLFETKATGDNAKGFLIMGDRLLQAIIISETEEIEVGDKYLVEQYKDKGLQLATKPATEEDVKLQKKFTCAKILALPEHFSPEQLQMIVDGKLKDGDEVMIKCEYEIVDNFTIGANWQIKLNQQNHITLLDVENKHQWMIDQTIKLQKYNSSTPLTNKDKEESWDDVFKILNNPDVSSGTKEAMIRERYHPPQRKSK